MYHYIVGSDSVDDVSPFVGPLIQLTHDTQHDDTYDLAFIEPLRLLTTRSDKGECYYCTIVGTFQMCRVTNDYLV